MLQAVSKKKNTKKQQQDINLLGTKRNFSKTCAAIADKIFPYSLTQILTLSQLEIILHNYNLTIKELEAIWWYLIPLNQIILAQRLQTVTPQGTTTQLSRTPAMVYCCDDPIFEFDFENILNLMNVEQTDVADDDTISFRNNMIIQESGNISVAIMGLVTVFSVTLILLLP